eukprot:6947243-Pyramimonas_sp.AAC.1
MWCALLGRAGGDLFTSGSLDSGTPNAAATPVGVKMVAVTDPGLHSNSSSEKYTQPVAKDVPRASGGRRMVSSKRELLIGSLAPPDSVKVARVEVSKSNSSTEHEEQY